MEITLLLPCAWDEHEEPQLSMMIRMLGGDHESFTGITVAANLWESLSNSSIDAKLPNHGRGWGVHVRSDIEIYLNILELICSAAGGEGVKVLVHILKIIAATKRSAVQWNSLLSKENHLQSQMPSTGVVTVKGFMEQLNQNRK